MACDLMRYGFSRMHFATSVVDELHKVWDNFFDNNSQEARYLQFLHSEGVANGNNALLSYDTEKRKKVHVIAVAPSVYIDPDICGSIVHLAGRDLVAQVDPNGRQKYAHTVVYCEPHPDADFMDHSFQSKTYTKRLNEYTDRFFIKGTLYPH